LPHRFTYLILIISTSHPPGIVLAVTKIDNFDDFGSLESEWNSLLSPQNEDNIVFYTPEWFRCWWSSFGENAIPFIILVRDQEQLIGIAPMMLRKKISRGLPVRMLSFMENGNSLHNNFILHPRRRKEALAAIVRHLMDTQSCWDITEFKNLPADSRNWSVLKEIITENKILFGQRKGLASPYITIHSDWETYYGSRSTKSRKTLRNIRNRFKRAGDFAIQEIKDYATFQRIAPELHDIARNSWTEEIGDSLNTPVNRSFFDRLARIAAEKGWLSVWLLKVQGDPVAFEYHLKYNGRTHGMRASHKKNYGRMSPGVFLDSYIVQQLFEKRDVAEYDLGGSFDDYKKKWTEQIRKHVSVHLYNRIPYSRFLYVYEYQFIKSLKAMIQRGGKVQ